MAEGRVAYFGPTTDIVDFFLKYVYYDIIQFGICIQNDKHLRNERGKIG